MSLVTINPEALGALIHEAPDVWLERRVLPAGGGPMRCTFVRTIAELLDYDQAEGEGVYWGIAPRLTQRGRAVDCGIPRCLAVDIDPEAGSISHAYLPVILRLLPVPPTVVLHSGRGVQIFMALSEEVEDWDQLSRGWTHTVREALADLPVRVDATHDRARIMRMPGSTNQKTGAVAQVLDFHPDRVYNGARFPVTDAPNSTVEEITGASAPGTRNPRLFQIASALKWRGGLRGDILLSVMQQVNGTICSPPLPRRELALMIDRLNDPNSAQPMTVSESQALASPSDVVALAAEHLVGQIMSVKMGGRTVWHVWTPQIGVWAPLPPHSAIRDWLVVARDNADTEATRRLLGRCLGLGGIDQVAKLMGSMSAAPTYMEDECLNRHDWILPVQNGYLDLRTLELTEPDPTLRFTRRAEVAYDPEAKCPRWDKFISEAVPDLGEAAFLGLLFYYCLSGANTSRAFIINLGGARNGKTVAWGTLTDLMGKFAGPGDQRVVTKSAESGHDAPVAALLHQRLAVYEELGKDDELDGSQVKRLTGGEKVRARAAFASEHIDIRMTAKHVLISNYRPKIQGEDLAVGDRLKYIQWRTRVAEKDVDFELRAKLADERSGILNWILKHGRQYWEGHQGLPMPPRLAAEAREYLEDENEMLGFVRRHVRIPESHNPGLSADGAALGRKWQEFTGEKLTGRKWSGFYRELLKTIEAEGGEVSLSGTRAKKLVGVVLAEPGEELA